MENHSSLTSIKVAILKSYMNPHLFVIY